MGNRPGNPHPFTYPIKTRLKVAALYTAGRSAREISVRTGVGHTTVRRICDEYHVPMRSIAEAKARPGNTTIDNQGYVLEVVTRDDPIAWPMSHHSRTVYASYVLQHRLVMARSIGRPLEATETVHHINGDRSDNRIENLELRSGNHGKGHVHRCLDCGSTRVEHASIASQ
jgi:hypothetical protein